MTKIVVFVGSLRKKSVNKMLAKNIERLASKEMKFEYISIALPLYSEDIETVGMPVEVVRVKAAVEAADGVLFVTPEYNRSIPGVLKNAIDWVSRPYGHSSFKDKPVGILGASTAPTGTAVAQADLGRIMLFQGARVLGQPEVYVASAHEVFDDQGRVISERWEKNFQKYITVFSEWIKN